MHISLKTLLSILLAATVMLIIVIALFVFREYGEYESRFNSDASNIFAEFRQNVRDLDAALNGFVSLYNAIDVVDQEQFSNYAQAMLQRYEKIHTVKLMTRVDYQYLNRFISSVRENSFPTFEIVEGEQVNPETWSKAKQRPFYFPITVIEPYDPEKIIEMGYDLYSLPVFRSAIDKAINSGEAIMTPSVKLMNGRDGYVVLKPVYAGRIMPDSVEQRRKQALYVVAIFAQADQLITHRLDKKRLEAKLYGKAFSGQSKADLLYRFGVELDGRQYAKRSSSFEYKNQLQIGGQILELNISSYAGFDFIRWNFIAAIIVVWAGFLSLILFIVNTHYLRLKEKKQSYQAWQWEKERADVTLHSLADAVITTNVKGVVEYMNPVAERLTGFKVNEVKGREIEDVFQLVDETTDKRIQCPVQECIQRDMIKESSEDISLIHKNGDYSSIDYSIAPMYGNENQVLGSVLVFQDVGAERMMSKLLSYQATHDDLTGLYNRREFERRMSRALEKVFNYNEHYILLYMDLDQFKVVNDTCGHVAGDLVLRQVAELVTPFIKDKEIFARLGGDEFGMLLAGYDQEEAKTLCKDILGAIRKYRFHWSSKVFEIGASIGMVDINRDMQSISNIMSYADAACYLAKDVGGNNVQVYQMDAKDYKERKDQMKWVQRITQAFADSRFMLYAQKIVPLQEDSAEEHYEVLMRMIDDNGDIIVPQEYIIAAERYRTMRDIDRWVIRNAFMGIDSYVKRRQQDKSNPRRLFSINLSGQSVSSDTAVEYIKEQLQEFPLVKEYVIFEITETAAISNMVRAQRFIEELREIGLKFSLDDFGTGVSSFNYLKNLDVDYLKIDGGFVREMLADKVDLAMVKSIIHIGHVMGIKTIAEHAETIEVCDKLKEMGADYAQGFCLHEPEAMENVIQ